MIPKSGDAPGCRPSHKGGAWCILVPLLDLWILVLVAVKQVVGAMVFSWGAFVGTVREVLGYLPSETCPPPLETMETK